MEKIVADKEVQNHQHLIYKTVPHGTLKNVWFNVLHIHAAQLDGEYVVYVAGKNQEGSLVLTLDELYRGYNLN